MKNLLLAVLLLTVCRNSDVIAAETEPTQSLDGAWQIVFDSQNEGGAKQWFYDRNFPADRQREIAVPSCWELIERDYEGVAFYRRTFTVPASWQGKVVRLQFDAVNFLCEVWLNDVAVGVHEGGFTPFEFRVDDLLKFDAENTLILRVAGPILLQQKRIDGIGPLETPQWRGAITGGVWQSARLLASDSVYVDDVFIEPNIADDSAAFHLQLNNAAATTVTAEVDITIHPAREPDRNVATFRQTYKLKPGENKQSTTLKIPDAIYWSPDNPHLYRAVVAVKLNETLSDRWNTRFGMREFTIRDKRFYLNGKPIYLKATFFEGLYPTKLAYPDSREMAVREIQLAKDAGFNMIRPWRKPPPPMWLDLADEIGVLTVGSLAVECMDYPAESARLPGWVENEVRESILRDRNRACVVQWELFNELKRPVLMRLLRPMAILARDLDPTRLILDESGGWAQGANIYLPGQYEPSKFNDIHDYPGPHVNEEVYEKLLLTGSMTHEQMTKRGLRGRLPGKNVVVGLMTFFSELGYGSLPDLEANNVQFAQSGNPIAPTTIYHRRLADQHLQVIKESGFDKVFPTLKQFCLDQQHIHGTANKRMIEAVRCNPNVAGYCIHALTAGDWIIGAGLLDLFRNPKGYVYEGTQAANQPRIVSIRVRPRNVYADQGTQIEVTGVNEAAAIGGKFGVEIVDNDGKSVFSSSADIDLLNGITRLFSEKLDTGSFQGAYTVRAKITSNDGSVIAENAYGFDVFTAEQLAVPRQRIAVLDPNNSLKPFLNQVGISVLAFNAQLDPGIPVFVSKSDAYTPQVRKRFEQLTRFINAGGTAVYLEGGGRRIPWGTGAKASPLLPVNARLKHSIGTWVGVSHVVHEHPIFAGLPVDCTMGSVYENVWATGTLLDFQGETIAASISFDWFPEYDRSKRHYYGPGDAWWGADVAVATVGKGRCVASQLRLTENLGKDPVADKILYNLIAWTTSSGAK